MNVINISLYHSNYQALKGEQGRVLKGCKFEIDGVHYQAAART